MLGGRGIVHPTVPIFKTPVKVLHRLLRPVLALGLVAKARKEFWEENPCNNQTDEHYDHHNARACAHIKDEGVGVRLEGGAVIKQLGLRGGGFLGVFVTHDEKILPFSSQSWERLRGFLGMLPLK